MTIAKIHQPFIQIPSEPDAGSMASQRRRRGPTSNQRWASAVLARS